MDNTVFDAATGLPIIGDNVIAFPRADAKPIPHPSENFAQAMTIRADLPVGATVDQVIDAAKRRELEELRRKFPEVYDPI